MENMKNHWTNFHQTWHKFFTQRENQHKIGVLGPGGVSKMKNMKYENTVENQIKGNFNASNNFTCIYELLKMFGPWGSINGL